MARFIKDRSSSIGKAPGSMVFIGNQKVDIAFRSISGYGQVLYIDQINLTGSGCVQATGTDVQTACDTYTWINGITYTASNNTAAYLFQTINGCDSLVTLNFTLTPSYLGTNIVASDTLNYTGAMQTYTVPAGVTSITIEAYGAQGGDGGPVTTGQGGLGGYATGDIVVIPGQILEIYVGGQGPSYQLAGTGGWNGGGGTNATSNDNKRPGGGGGSSDVRINGSSLYDRIIVGAGGGGASGWQSSDGGYGGGLIGQDGQPPI